MRNERHCLAPVYLGRDPETGDAIFRISRDALAQEGTPERELVDACDRAVVRAEIAERQAADLRGKLAEYRGMTTRKMALSRACEWLTEDHSDVALAAIGDILGIGDEDALRHELILLENAEREETHREEELRPTGGPGSTAPADR